MDAVAILIFSPFQPQLLMQLDASGPELSVGLKC